MEVRSRVQKQATRKLGHRPVEEEQLSEIRTFEMVSATGTRQFTHQDPSQRPLDRCDAAHKT